MNLAADGAKPEMTWFLADLLKVPATAEADAYPAQQVEGVRSLLMEGTPYRGQATQLFAYYAAPKGAASGQRLAGPWSSRMAGGGTAYAKYIQMWNDRGYAAIALIFMAKPRAGSSSAGAGGAEQGLSRSLWGRAANAGGGMELSCRQRNHQGTFLVAMQLSGGEPEKTGLVGTSWGGIHACIAAGLDPRFKVVVAIYGCGFLSGRG